jgi:hypothetical protein
MNPFLFGFVPLGIFPLQKTQILDWQSGYKQQIVQHGGFYARRRATPTRQAPAATRQVSPASQMEVSASCDPPQRRRGWMYLQAVDRG